MVKQASTKGRPKTEKRRPNAPRSRQDLSLRLEFFHSIFGETSLLVLVILLTLTASTLLILQRDDVAYRLPDDLKVLLSLALGAYLKSKASPKP